jgi:hypothetical protein
MELVLLIETKNLQKTKDILLKDNEVSRASIIFKEATAYGGKAGFYYCYISGLDDLCKRAMEIAKDLVKEAKDKEKENLIKKIKEEEDKATEAFGGIFE